MTSQKLRKCAFIYLFCYFKHKINYFAVELGRAVSLNVSHEMRGGRNSCGFSAAMRLLSGKALNTLLYLIKNFNTSNWNADIPQGRSHLFSHNQKHLVPQCVSEKQTPRSCPLWKCPPKSDYSNRLVLPVLYNDVTVPSLVLKAALSRVTQQCILFLIRLLFLVAFKYRPIIVMWNASVFRVYLREIFAKYHL